MGITCTGIAIAVANPSLSISSNVITFLQCDNLNLDGIDGLPIMLSASAPNSREAISFLIECLYRNDTRQPQIIRICNLPGVYWERVVLPGQCITFQTSSTAQLEVVAGPITTMVADHIPCQSLSLRSLKPSKQPIPQQSLPLIMPA